MMNMLKSISKITNGGLIEKRLICNLHKIGCYRINRLYKLQETYK